MAVCDTHAAERPQRCFDAPVGAGKGKPSMGNTSENEAIAMRNKNIFTRVRQGERLRHAWHSGCGKVHWGRSSSSTCGAEQLPSRNPGTISYHQYPAT